MAVKVPCAGAWVKVQGYSLNVTLRDYPGSEFLLAKGEDAPEPSVMIEVLSRIVTETVNNWLMVTRWLQGDTVADNRVSPEGSILQITSENEDPLVTVWGKYYGVSLTVVSNEAPIYAYRAMKSWSAGVRAAGCSWDTGKPNGGQQAQPPRQPEPPQQRRVGNPPPPDTMVEAGKQFAGQTMSDVSPTDANGEGIETVNCKSIKCKHSDAKGKNYYVLGGVTVWSTSELTPIVEAGIPVDKLSPGLAIDMNQYPDWNVKVHYVMNDKGFRQFMGLDVVAPPPQGNGHPF
jgi:hypothetical protein